MGAGARFIRTFLQLAAGVAAAAAVLDWTTDWRGSAVFVALGLIAAVIGAGVAALQAVAGWTANTPITKGAVTFAQSFGPAIAVLGVNEWTNAAFLMFGQGVYRALLAAVAAAVAAYVQNVAEQHPPVAA